MSNEYEDWAIKTAQAASATLYEVYSLITLINENEEMKNETTHRIVTNFLCSPYFKYDAENGEQAWTAIDWLLDTLVTFSDFAEEASYQKYKELLDHYGWQIV